MLKQNKQNSIFSQTQKSSTSDTSDPPLSNQKYRRVSKQQIEQMNHRVQSELIRNKKTYDKLLTLNPYFSIKLYTISNSFTPEEYHSGSIDKMIKQLQMLLDDGRVLEKEIVKAQLKQMQNEYSKQNYGSQCRQHYAYLRKIWLTSHDNESERPMDILEQLNKKVVLMKNNLFSMIQLEKKSYNKAVNNQYEHVQRKIADIVVNMEQYQLLKEEYERTRMGFQELFERFVRREEEMSKKVGQRNEVIRQLKFQNEQLKRNNKQLKQKLLKNQNRQDCLANRRKQDLFRHQMKVDLAVNKPLVGETRSPIRSAHQVLNIETIKFQKIDHHKDLILSPNRLPNKQQQPPKTSSFEPNTFKSPQVTKKESEENFNNLNNQSNYDRRSQLNDAKSVDGKRGGRFVRMRSPGGGKLMKKKENDEKDNLKAEFGSPSLRDFKERRSHEVGMEH